MDYFKKKQNIATLAIFLLFGLAALFIFGRIQRNQQNIAVAKIIKIDGKIDIKSKNSAKWQVSTNVENVFAGDQIKTGETSTATIMAEDKTIILGPRAHVTFNSFHNEIFSELLSGELLIKTSSSPLLLQIHSFNRFSINPQSEFIVSTSYLNASDKNIYGQVIKGSVAFEDGKSSQNISPESGAFILGNQKQPGLWLVLPGIEENIPNKEGFAAVTFQWGQSNEISEGVHLSLRSLADGEFVIHENVTSGMTLTLKQGTYIWSIHRNGNATPARRFYITGMKQNTQNEAESPTNTANITPAPNTEVSSIVPLSDPPIPTSVVEKPQTPTKPEVTASINSKEQSSLENKTASSNVPSSHDKENQELTSGTTSAPNLKIITPKNAAQISVSNISEQRISWHVNPKPEFIELEVIGSALNPTLRYQLAGTRTRQKLTELPPGRYSVRIRGIVADNEQKITGPWTESVFDVVQTLAGQLAPTNVKAEIISKKTVKKLNLSWDKSSAPIYQIMITNSSNATSVRSTTESSLSVPIANKSPYKISICAMDANRMIRGCAPEVLLEE